MTLIFRTIALCLALGAVTTVKAEQGPSYFLVEGAYALETLSQDRDTEQISDVSQLVIFKNLVGESFTVAFSMPLLDEPYLLISNAQAAFSGDSVRLTGAASAQSIVYGEMTLNLHLSTGNVWGEFSESHTNSKSRFTGKPNHRLTQMIYDPTESGFQFPPIKDILGEYVSSNGDLAILRTHESGAITFVIRKSIGRDQWVNIPYRDGDYDQENGLLKFGWEADRKQGRTSVAYEMDPTGRPILNVLTLVTNGNHRLHRFTRRQ